MTTKRCSLLKISMLLILLAGIILPDYAQNLTTGAHQNSTGNAVIYNQSGIGTSILIVFGVLIIVLLVFKYIARMMSGEGKKRVPSVVPTEAPAAPKADPEGEVHAAIAMALYLYGNELHDQENPVITMIRVSKTYSPWSSKIYGLRKSPR